MGSLRDLLRAIESDLRLPSLPWEPVSIVTVDPDRAVGEVSPTLSEFALSGAPGSDIFIERRGHCMRLPSGPGETALCLAMWKIQDDLMDDLARPWLEVVSVEGASSVLIPVIAGDDRAMWSDAKGRECPVGSLRRHFGPLVRW